MIDDRTIDITPRSGPCLAPMVLAAIAGAAHGASFAPVVTWWAEIVALAVSTGIVARACSGRAAALAGLGFGLGWFGSGVYWLYISMHVYGGMAAWLAALAVVLFCAFIALYPALAAWAWWRLRARLRTGWHAAAFALAWTASEWLRATMFTGFPWIATGYAHVDGPLAGYAPLGGVNLVTLLAAFAAAALAGLLDHLGRPARPWDRHGRRAAFVSAAVALALLAAGAALAQVRWTQASGAPVSVRLLQGNIPQDAKFEPDHLLAQYQLYHQLATAAPADLIVLPETALPVPIQDGPPGYLDALASYARETGSTIVSGVFILERDAATGEARYNNSAIAIGPDAPAAIVDHTGLPAYRKHHLVPFGEFIPWGFRWFVDAMTIPIGDQESGPIDQAPFTLARRTGGVVRIGPNICYEDYFGDEIAARLQRADAPDILLNLTNIAWFGDSSALPQHLLASRMRAIETGRPMLRATNTGATAVVGSDGKVQAELAPFTRGALAAQVQGMTGSTPYMRWLDWPVLALCLAGLALAVWRGRRH